MRAVCPRQMECVNDDINGKAMTGCESCCSGLRRAAPAHSAAPRALSAVLAHLQPRRRPPRTPSRRPRSRWCTPSPSTRTASSPWMTVSAAEHFCLGGAVTGGAVNGVGVRHQCWLSLAAPNAVRVLCWFRCRTPRAWYIVCTMAHAANYCRKKLEGNRVVEGAAATDTSHHGCAIRVIARRTGEPREIADPANRPFMESIGRGECPQELEPPSRDLPVSVNLVRSRADYTPPARPAYTAFHGTGRTLAGASLALAVFAFVNLLPMSSVSTSMTVFAASSSPLGRRH